MAVCGCGDLDTDILWQKVAITSHFSNWQPLRMVCRSNIPAAAFPKSALYPCLVYFCSTLREYVQDYGIQPNICSGGSPD
jgi:hypothetical protein